MWDLAESKDSVALLKSFYNAGKPIASVCQSPSVLRQVTYQGAPLVKGKHLADFTNREQAEMHLTDGVPSWSRMNSCASVRSSKKGRLRALRRSGWAPGDWT